jgi:hypothetical protein
LVFRSFRRRHRHFRDGVKFHRHRGSVPVVSRLTPAPPVEIMEMVENALVSRTLQNCVKF